tara:strand:+ start:1654 stop:2109 length:456 start_codon:yes stop_codon:yes gene_type:complete
MSKIIIGVDPDSKAHGVAVYSGGKLIGCEAMPLLSVYFMLIEWVNGAENINANDVTVHMENVCGMNAVFKQRQKANQAINMKMSNSVGKCQQSQVELERVFEYFGIKVVKHKISKMWKKDKAQFEKVTGWKGRSNEDTRSAAWFGYMGLNN